ncbi:uncharacterized protein NECHADRAFT_85522 [Fusarium vanettenii 77-13-4]|uniref:Zn(2)-C6 fungal-type domain-containing protein n=1 Tax=Fusarium vanettenii (strain ATCC MYA-4622 / CBS 123669 / FGSC 9596 / NRRL 45880 / 77-13-4) TaxID=660122 RepID=C7ZP36_FUSV7|nr:uncharacterized protein NECHADRAFT_85522 [Fusarium vanettenii 77-13-4]EEU34053.1 hypothetical protein NECHADRAFT_85522 [Fusarium vanettenii 77-13-4]
MTAPVQLVEKASRTCTRCRVRKQRCDRLLPGCSRCTLKLVRCDYSTTPNGHSCMEATGSYVEFGSCGWDLSAFGQSELMKLAMNGPADQHSNTENRPSNKLGNILSEVNLTPHILIEDYTRSIHNWFPIVNIGQLRPRIYNPSTPSTDTSTTCLCLAILLVATPTRGHMEHFRQKRLYTTLQCLCTALESQNEIGIPLAQAKSLIVLYECGHGLARQAYLTLSSTVAMMSLLGGNAESTEEQMHLEVCLMILDRLPLIRPTSSVISARVAGQIDSPRTEPFPLGPISQRIRSMGQVVFLSGRALEHLQGSKVGIRMKEDYDLIDSDLESMLDHLLSHKDSYSGSYCDPTTLALCCLFIIRQERVRELNTQPGSKAYLALQACRRMVWDTCRESLDSNKESAPTCDEIDQLVPTLRMFAQRWTVGYKYLDRILARGKSYERV